MSDNRISLFRRVSYLTDEFRRVVSQNLRSTLEDAQEDALEAMLKVHRKNREESLLYRFLDHPWLLPLSSLLEGLKAFSGEIEDNGVAAASADLFRKMGIRLQIELTPQARSILEDKHPILLAGEHPANMGFDYFAVAASLGGFWQDKIEPRLLAIAMTTGMCPGLRHSVFPTVTTRDKEIQFLAAEIGARRKLVPLWAPEVERGRALYITTHSMDEAVSYWLNGGHILIFPDAGRRDKKWFPGIGRIVLEALRRLNREGDVDPYILFFYLKGAKDYLILNRPFVSRAHPARLILLGKKKGITIQHQKLFRLRDYRDMFLAMNKTTLTGYLEREYQGQKVFNPLHAEKQRIGV